MITEDKITVFFCIADVFRNFFDTQIARKTFITFKKRKMQFLFDIYYTSVHTVLRAYMLSEQ